MIRKLCATGVMVAAAAGVTLLASPAHADDRTDNRSANRWASQSGNNFHNLRAFNHGRGRSVNVNNVNGFTTTAANGSIAVTYIFH